MPVPNFAVPYAVATAPRADAPVQPSLHHSTLGPSAIPVQFLVCINTCEGCCLTDLFFPFLVGRLYISPHYSGACLLTSRIFFWF